MGPAIDTHWHRLWCRVNHICCHVSDIAVCIDSCGGRLNDLQSTCAWMFMSYTYRHSLSLYRWHTVCAAYKEWIVLYYLPSPLFIPDHRAEHWSIRRSPPLSARHDVNYPVHSPVSIARHLLKIDCPRRSTLKLFVNCESYCLNCHRSRAMDGGWGYFWIRVFGKSCVACDWFLGPALISRSLNPALIRPWVAGLEISAFCSRTLCWRLLDYENASLFWQALQPYISSSLDWEYE